MQLPMLAVVAEVVVETEVVVEETEVAKAVTTPATTAPNPPKTLMLSTATALLRRRRKVFGSSLQMTKTFMITPARCATAPPRRTTATCALSADLDRMLQRDALISARLPHLHGSHPEISGPIQSNPESSTPVGRTKQHGCCRGKLGG